MPNVDSIRDHGLSALRVQQERFVSTPSTQAESVPAITKRAVAAGIQRAVESGQRVMRPEALDLLGEQRQNVMEHLVNPRSAQAPAGSVPGIAKQAVATGLQRALNNGQRFLRLEALDHLGRHRTQGVGNHLDQQG